MEQPRHRTFHVNLVPYREVLRHTALCRSTGLSDVYRGRPTVSRLLEKDWRSSAHTVHVKRPLCAVTTHRQMHPGGGRGVDATTAKQASTHSPRQPVTLR